MGGESKSAGEEGRDTGEAETRHPGNESER